MEIDEEKIIDLFTDKTGRDLITCMLLFQPITKKELRYFLDTLFKFYIINVSKNYDYRKDNPLCCQKYSIFKKSTLDQKDRAFHKALESELIIEIQENTRARNKFYMINSNLRFQISGANNFSNILKIDVFNNSKSFNISHKINLGNDKYINPLKKILEEHKKAKITSNEDFINYIFTPKKEQPNQNHSKSFNERISLPNEEAKIDYSMNSVPYFNSINQIISLLHWLCCPKHRYFITNYIQEADDFGHVSKKDLSTNIRKNEYFQKEALKNNFLFSIDNKSSNYQLSNLIMFLKKDSPPFEFFFARSYNPLFCFSNYIEHSDNIEKGISPADLLNILTEGKKSKIIPERRNKLVFSSLLYKPSYLNIKKSASLQERVKNKYSFISLRNTKCIKRDIFDIIPENNSIINSLNDIDKKNKLYLSNYSFGGGFLFSND